MDAKWQFWIDRGGTFTDVIARRPDGTLSSHKYLSENPGCYRDAAVHAMREIMGVDEGQPFPSTEVQSVKMGTTVATNALLERAGADTLLLTTEGFRDALLIGQQHRQDLFALKPSRPRPLYADVETVKARFSAEGDELVAFDTEDCRAALTPYRARGITSIAIVFLHGYRYPAHEEQAARIAAELGFTQISASHRVSPLMKLIPRGDTTVADAYLSPVLKRYVSEVRAAVSGTPLYFMQSSGGLASADAFEGKDAVLSGPAGGIVGAVATAAREGADKIIGFDMGGTSTDVSHYGGAVERVIDTTVAGVRMTVPMMDIHTVAAGGGSVCRFEQGRYLVGPASAGAYPGPACYRRGGPLTVTDCNVILGKIQPDLFPAVFGPDGRAPLDPDAARAKAQTVAARVADATGQTPTAEDVAAGFLSVAVEHMARAIKRISVERGHDVTRYALLSFGGAGGQHACLVADALGMTEVLIPPFSGVLSALGMGLADQTAIRERALECPLEDLEDHAGAIKALEQTVRTALTGQGVPAEKISCKRRARIKYRGSDTALTVSLSDQDQMLMDFERAHQTAFGFVERKKPLIVEAVEAEATGGGQASSLNVRATGGDTAPISRRTVTLGGQLQSVDVYDRAALQPETEITGPAVIVEAGGTTILEPGWNAVRTGQDTLILKRRAEKEQASVNPDTVNPVLLEVFNNLFMSVAEEMGAVLAKTAHSVNVKERLDFSCAVFNAAGELIANAPHMPVHLGSMGDSVAAIIARHGRSLSPGDAYILNDPYAGGTHLPDITVISPVFTDGKHQPDYFVASRGHHADVGGISPGSMPAFSTAINEEGVCINGDLLVRDGAFREAWVRRTLAHGPYPARNPDQNIADLKAQVAANERGAAQVRALVHSFGTEVVSAYMTFVQNNAEEAVRQVIDRLKDGSCRYPMDCGGVINVSLAVDPSSRSVIVDFSGTSSQLLNNFNAPLAVTKAAVLYVFRLLTQADIPLNAGCLKPITLKVPKGSMLNPDAPAAVVAGNVETSQAVTNALLIASGAMAASQGTMNNVTFGNAHHQYYETIAGGTGAGPDFAGTDAIQSHMTNSRLTDPEVLEWRYPVRVRNFCIRPGSGGDGRHQGGNGALRDLEFLEDMEVSILSSSRKESPQGLAGGDGGQPGENLVIRRSGKRVDLKAADRISLEAGDRLVIKTPGGGGYGQPV